MSDSAVNHKNSYLDHPRDISKHNCLINFPGNSSYGCKVLWEFGSKYYKRIPTKDHGYDTETRNKFNIQKDKNAIFNHPVDKIIPREKIN